MIVQEDERLDFSKVPQSAGFPPMLFGLLAIGLIGIFTIGGVTAFMSGYGHHWPSPTTQRVPLVNSDNP